MSSLTDKLSAADQVLQGIKFHTTPEERQLLGITDEYMAQLSDPQSPLTAPVIERSVEKLIERAYQNVPAFKKLVMEDQQKDPRRFIESARLVSKFLMHLKSSLPPGSAAWIDSDTFMQAHQLVAKIAEPLASAAAPADKQYSPLVPLRDEDLALFGLKRAQLTADIQFPVLEPHLQYFLGTLQKNGKTVKNKGTSKMPDELRADYIFRLLREIREKKLAQKKSLAVFELTWLGKDLSDLERKAHSYVKREVPKQKATKGTSYESVLPTVGEILLLTKRLSEMFKGPDMREALMEASNNIDSALPSDLLIEDRIKTIQSAVNELGLTKDQASKLLRTNTLAMEHTPEITPEMESTIKAKLGTLAQEIATKSDETIKQKKTETKQDLEKQLADVQAVSGKDTTKLFAAVRDYLDLLSTYKESALKKLSYDIPGLDTVIESMTDIKNKFHDISSIDWFVRKWKNRPNWGNKKPETESESVAPAEDITPDEKTAAETKSDSDSYSKAIKDFRKSGAMAHIDDITAFMEDAVGGLEFLRNKLYNIAQADESVKKTRVMDEIWLDKYEMADPSDSSSENAPLPEEDPETNSLSKINSKLAKILGYLKELDMTEKKTEAIEILQMLADIPGRVLPGVVEKKASVASRLRRIASMLLYAATPYKAPGKSDWFRFRERFTRAGKKALLGVFNDTPFVAKFVEDMELANLNNRIAKNEAGEKALAVEAVDVDPILEKVMQGITKSDDDFESMLGTKLGQEVKKLGDIKKKKKEMEEASERVLELNQKIKDVNAKYLPVLASFDQVLSDPLGTVREQIDRQRPGGRDDSDSQKQRARSVFPKDITRENYQTVLKGMLNRYRKGVTDKMADTLAPIPTDEFRRVHGITLQLRDLKKRIDDKKKQIEDARQTLIEEKDLEKRSRMISEYNKSLVESAKMAKEYLETAIYSLLDTQKYIDIYKDTIKTDEATLNGLKIYLSSEEGKRVPDAAESKAMLAKLKDNFEHEASIFRTLTEKAEKASEKYDKAREYLIKLNKDLADKKVEQIYSVAWAPEMEPPREEAQEIKQRAKERDKGLSDLIDMSTYKKNMNWLMSQHTNRGPAPAYKGKGMTAELPSIRAGEAALELRKNEAFRKSIDRIKDEYDKNRSKMLFYKKQIDIYESMERDIVPIEKVLQKLTYVQKSLQFLEAKRDLMDPDSAEKDHEDLTAILEQYDLTESELDKAVDLEKSSFEQYKELMENLKPDIPAYKKSLESFKSKEKIGPQSVKKMRERLMQLRVERAGLISSRKNLTHSELKKHLEFLQKQRQKIVSKPAASGEHDDAREKEFQKIYNTMEAVWKYPTNTPKKFQFVEKLYERLDALGLTEDERAYLLKNTDDQIAELKEPLESASKLSERVRKLDKEIAELSEKTGEPSRHTDVSDNAMEYSPFEPRHLYTPSTPQPVPTTKTIGKYAAIEDTREPKTEFEKALDERGSKPAPYMRDLPKPKNWEFVEHFFDDAKKQLAYLESVKKKGKDWDSTISEHYLKWIAELEKVIPAIDAYKNQIIKVGPEAVPLRDIVIRFEEKLMEYQELFSQALRQREDAQKRLEGLQQDVDFLNTMFDPETGEYKGLGPDEIAGLKKLFFKELYRYLDGYWSSRVGENISVFGKRNTEWYNNVFRTFKNVADVRSNRKLMTLLNKYKEATQSEFPKDASVRLNRIQALQEKLDSFARGLKDQTNLKGQAIDPTRSAEYNELLTKLNNYKAQAEQIDTVFRNMASTVMLDIHDKTEKKIGEKMGEDKPSATADLSKKTDQKLEESVGVMEASLEKAIELEEGLKQAEIMVESLEKTVPAVPAPTTKTAYDRSHPDFDLKILYGSVMQKTIASMLRL